MSLVFNEAALNFLLESPEGPVGQDLRRRSDNVAIAYEEFVARYLPAFVQQGGSVEADIVSGDDGLQANIDIKPGHGSERFAENVTAKIAREPERVTDALEEIHR